MICYKDMTFCARKNCVNTKCYRNVNRSDFEPGDMPVAYACFQSCKDFKERLDEIQRAGKTAG